MQSKELCNAFSRRHNVHIVRTISTVICEVMWLAASWQTSASLTTPSHCLAEEEVGDGSFEREGENRKPYAMKREKRRC
ncbi:hypothetical protein BgiBS90_008394 [Biomphalaria glabrata]|nr:hypothetical protein BgiBS90_008394 [Biomphalaria glabrata]